MRKLLLFSAVALFLLNQNFLLAQGSWNPAATFPGNDKYGAPHFTIDSLGYMGMGSGFLQDFWEYNANSDTWTTKASFSGTARIDGISFSIGQKGYVGLGHSNTNQKLFDIYEFDPVVNTWSSVTTYPGIGNRYCFATATESKAYIGTGMATSPAFSSDVWEYDPILNSWNQMQDFPGGNRFQAISFVINNQVYVGGGFDSTLNRTSEFWKLIPELDTWVQISSFPYPISHATPFVIGNRAYLCGGAINGGTYIQDLWVYDPNSDQWTQKAFYPGGARWNSVAFSINNKGYVGTGGTVSGSSKGFWEYTPDTINSPLSACTLPAYVPTNGLVGYWPFCGNANDISGNNNHGTVNGASLTTDRDGNVDAAYDFDGLDDYINVAHDSSLDFSSNSTMTSSMWVYFDALPPSSKEYQLLMKVDGAGSTSSGYQAAIFDNGEYTMRGKNGNGTNWIQTNSTPLSVSSYHHLVTVIKGDSTWVYVDGVLSNDTVIPGAVIGANTNDMIFGWNYYFTNGTSIAFDGVIDDIALWNRALTSNEISQIYSSSCAKPDFISLGTERTTALCPDDSVKIFVVNPQGPGLTYQWYKSDAIIPGAVDSFYYASEVRKYKVRVSSGPGCFRTSGRIQPTVAIPPSVTITPQGSTDICAGDSVLLVANYVPGYSYQWRRYGVDIPGATDTMFYASQPGNYKIFITNDGGCISKSSNVSVNIVCRLAGSFVANDVEVMPNPTRDNFSVKLNDLGEEIPISVEFIDQQGRLIESRRVNGQSMLEFTASGLSNGNYTVIVRFESGETVEKVVSVVR